METIIIERNTNKGIETSFVSVNGDNIEIDYSSRFGFTKLVFSCEKDGRARRLFDGKIISTSDVFSFLLIPEYKNQITHKEKNAINTIISRVGFNYAF